jgi:hypothetical protein
MSAKSNEHTEIGGTVIPMPMIATRSAKKRIINVLPLYRF